MIRKRWLLAKQAWLLAKQTLPWMVAISVFAAVGAGASGPALTGTEKDPGADKPKSAAKAEAPNVAGYPSEAKGTEGLNAAPNVVRVLRTTDKAQANVYVPGVFEVTKVNPYEVSKFIEDAVMAENGLITTYANPDTGGNSGLILVVVPEYQLDKIREVVKQLDRPNLTNVSGTAYDFINVKHRSVSNDHLALSNPEFLGQTTDFVKSLLFYGGPDTTITPDVKTNSLMVTGAPAAVDAVRAAVINYDVPRDQILISVKVYEVEASNDATLGLDFLNWKNGPGQNLLFATRRKFDFDIGGVEREGNWRQYGHNVQYPAEFFDFLTVKGKARVVNELRGAVINGFPATFNVFDNILSLPGSTGKNERSPVQTAFRTVARSLWGVDSTTNRPPSIFNSPGQPDSPNPTQQAVTPEEAAAGPERRVAAALVPRSAGDQEGIFLTIRPLISRGNIDLEVQTRVESFLGFDDAGVPQISERSINTQARATNGEPVVLGGMKRVYEVKTTRKVPILGDIPVLGYVFGGEITGKKTVMIYEVITPTILQEGQVPESDQTTMKQAEGTEKAPMPPDTYFFDQYILK